MTLTCVIYGYASFPGPLVWRHSDTRLIEGPKYSVMSTNTKSQLLIHENGATTFGILMSLTIKDLSPQDAGGYLCDTGSNSSFTALSITGGTSRDDSTGKILVVNAIVCNSLCLKQVQLILVLQVLY